MTTPNERENDKLREMVNLETDQHQLVNFELDENSAVYQQVEALFDLLRRPATSVEAHKNDDLVAGKMLGEFTIIRPLASGGMGRVFLARQESLKRLVALKVCKPEIAHDARLKGRFVAEALSLAQLAHPNVVPVLSTGEDQGNLFLAMEYVAGPTLARVLLAIQEASPDVLASTVVARVLASPAGESQNQPWKKDHAILDRAFQTWVIQALQQVAQGLAAAHNAGILHRDVKPANIVFTANGIPKIVDFGLARTPQAPSATVSGEFYGTPAYTSPEQARGDASAVSPASDVFSFGVTLYECLALDRPFPGRTAADVLSSVLNSDAPLLRKAEKRIPWELEAITDKCLRKKPSERYSSAQPLADDLQNFLELRPVSAKSLSRIGRIGRTIRRRPWAAAFLVALASATVLSTFVAKHAWAEHRAEQKLFFVKRVDEGDAALFQCLTGQRPTWLPAFTEQHRSRAIGSYSAALDIDPNAVWPLVQRARVYASQKETLGLALADFEKAQRLQPDFGSIRKFRGYVLDELGRSDEGRAARDEANNLDAKAAYDLYWLGVIAYSKEEDFVASYGYFSRVLLNEPNDYWSRLERAYFGRLTSEDNVRSRVIPELEIAKTIRPDLPFASEMLARLYSTDQSHGYVIDAHRDKKELEELVERFGLDILRAHDMSQLLQRENKNDEAETILRKVLDQDTGGRTASLVGDLKFRLRNFEQARDWYRRAISEGANDPVAYMKLAHSCTAMQDWKAAETAYLDGIAARPTHAFLYWNLGSWYEKRARIADAESTFREGCELPISSDDKSVISPAGDVAFCFQNLAALMGNAGRPVEQVQVIERGIARLEAALANANHVEKESAMLKLAELKGELGKAWLIAGRRHDALTLIDTELKKKPFRSDRARWAMEILRLAGMGQSALEVARVAEFTAAHEANSNDRSTLQLVSGAVDGELWKLGLFRELRDRLETRRALGEELEAADYRWLGNHIYKGAESLAILEEGVNKYPEFVDLHSDYMQALAKVGRKDDALKAYETARDVYFAQVEKGEGAALRSGYRPSPIPPMLVAQPWYCFLLGEGNDQELRRLENRLREACALTKTDAKNLLHPRAFAEFNAGNYAAAVKSLESCARLGLWNEVWTKWMVFETLGKSLDHVGRRADAIQAYRIAVEESHAHPGVLSEFLRLVVQEEGINGLLKEMPNYDKARLDLDVRRNATLTSFSAWAALATGDDKAAFENLVKAGPYVLLASQQEYFRGDEALVVGVILQIVAEKLDDSKRLAGAIDFLKQFPAERVTAMQKAFSLSK